MRCPCRCLFDRCRHLPGIHVHVVVYQRDMQKNVPLSLVMINDVVVAHGKRDLPVSPSTPPRSRCARLPPSCCATTDCATYTVLRSKVLHTEIHTPKIPNQSNSPLAESTLVSTPLVCQARGATVPTLQTTPRHCHRLCHHPL